MTPRREPDRNHDGEREPSELTEAFHHPVAPLEPPPGTYDTVRSRARGRRLGRVLWTGVAAAGCAAAVAVTLTVTGDGGSPTSVAVSPEKSSASPAEQQRSAPGGDQRTAPPSRRATPTPLNSAPPGGTRQPPAPPVATGHKDAAGEPPTCATADLTLSLGPGEGAAGSSYRPLRITNDSAVPCSLYGFPGVSMVDSAGHQVGKPADRDGPQASGRVVMKPGQREQATLRILTAAVATDPRCDATDAAGIRVYPPGERAFEVISVKGLDGCADSQVTTMTITSFGVHAG